MSFLQLIFPLILAIYKQTKESIESKIERVICIQLTSWSNLVNLFRISTSLCRLYMSMVTFKMPNAMVMMWSAALPTNKTCSVSLAFISKVKIWAVRKLTAAYKETDRMNHIASNLVTRGWWNSSVELRTMVNGSWPQKRAK